MSSELNLLNQLKLLDHLDDLDRQFSVEDDTSNVLSDFGNDVNPVEQYGLNLTQKPQKPDVVHSSNSSVDSKNPLNYLSCSEFQSQYGFTKESVQEIYKMIEYGFKTETRRGNPKSPMYSLLLTLQFLTTGSMDHRSERASQSTVCRILKRITGLLAELKPRFVKIPEASRSKMIAEKFKNIGDFPNVFACIGSTHIAIKTPVKSVADDYMNEDAYYSYRVFACTGPDLQFYEIISRWPGASHENKIFNLSEMFQRFEFTTKMDGVLLANERYSCTNYVMTPVETSKECENDKIARYNLAHKRTYNFFDAIKLLKGRFRCLQNVLAFQDGESFIISRIFENDLIFFFNFRNRSINYHRLCGFAQFRSSEE